MFTDADGDSFIPQKSGTEVFLVCKTLVRIRLRVRRAFCYFWVAWFYVSFGVGPGSLDGFGVVITRWAALSFCCFVFTLCTHDIYGVCWRFSVVGKLFFRKRLGGLEEMSPPAQLWRVYRAVEKSGGEGLTRRMVGCHQGKRKQMWKSEMEETLTSKL